MGTEIEIPLFPLSTVLFPGGVLPLRIFEPRYLDMVSRCMRQDRGFGVLLNQRTSADDPGRLTEVGTLARIADWRQDENGLLGILTVGQQRFRLTSSRRQRDGLYLGIVELLAPEPALPLPDDMQSLARVVDSVLSDIDDYYELTERDPEDAAWVSYRLAEVLPMTLEQKQACLELQDPLRRLQMLTPLLRKLRDS